MTGEGAKTLKQSLRDRKKILNKTERLKVRVKRERYIRIKWVKEKGERERKKKYKQERNIKGKKKGQKKRKREIEKEIEKGIEKERKIDGKKDLNNER